MKTFDVYPLLPITPVRAEGCYIWDDNGTKYLDLYGGHAVISVGHSHPDFVKAISAQLKEIGFYSNSVQIPIQQEYARKLGKLSEFPEYSLFLVNSGAEAIENALKLASFKTGRKKVVAFKDGFHGRTSLAVSITDNPKISAEINKNHETVMLELNDVNALEGAMHGNDVAAVIIEGIQGIGGIYEPTSEFLNAAEQLCKKYGTVLILDEIQSGFGRTGKFFAHQHAEITPDLITMAKGMGNGFPMGGVLISPDFEASYGLLGTTFGGSYLASAAGLAVLEIMEKENLMANAEQVGDHLINELNKLDVVEVRGKGLMIGIEFSFPIKELRQKLLNEHMIFPGVASQPNTLRILPPLSLTIEQSDVFIDALAKTLKNETVSVN